MTQKKKKRSQSVKAAEEASQKKKKETAQPARSAVDGKQSEKAESSKETPSSTVPQSNPLDKVLEQLIKNDNMLSEANKALAGEVTRLGVNLEQMRKAQQTIKTVDTNPAAEIMKDPLIQQILGSIAGAIPDIIKGFTGTGEQPAQKSVSGEIMTRAVEIVTKESKLRQKFMSQAIEAIANGNFTIQGKNQDVKPR